MQGHRDTGLALTDKKMIEISKVMEIVMEQSFGSMIAGWEGDGILSGI